MKLNFSAKELAQILSGTIEGDENARVSRFMKIENGKQGALCFFANPKYEEYVYTSEATILLVNKDFVPKHEVRPTLLRVENAYLALADLLKYIKDSGNKYRRHRSLSARYFCSTKFGKKVYVGSHSYIGRNTTVGDFTRIGENVTIGEGTTIGRKCIIYPGVRIYPGMVIGDNVIIHCNAVIGSDGFGNAPQPDGTWKKIEHFGNVIIGNDVEIGPNTIIGRSEMESTIIGNGVKIDALCAIAHNVVIGDNTAIAGQTGIAGSTKIGKNCIIAGQVGITGHITIADNTTIGAQAGVIGNIRKSGQVLVGSPAIDAKHYMKAYAKFKAAAE